MTAPLRIACVGGCHRDVVARTDGPFEPGTSCPGLAVERPGGVARNVAVLLARSGFAPVFAGRVGADAAGLALRTELADAGADVGALAADPNAPTGTYLAIHDVTGELVAAVSSLRLYDRITPDALPVDRLASCGLVFADANLPEPTLTALAAHLGPKLAVDAISRAKGPRVLPALRSGAIGFLNRTTAEALAGRPSASPADAAAALVALGVRRAVVTCGPAPVALIGDADVREIAVPPRAVVDVTGAGDALTAATLAALACGASLGDAVAVGIEAAGAALGSVGALDRLPAPVADMLACLRAGGSP